MAEFEISIVTVGPLGTNCCLVRNRETQETIIVDPGDEPEKILGEVKAMGGKPAAILLTHGHYDHTQGVAGILEKAGKLPVAAGEKEKRLFRDEALNFTPFGDVREVCPDTWVRDGETLSLAGAELRVIGTPGHTAGSVCYYMEETETLFAGDTLFYRSYGRTDLPTGNERDMWGSLRKLLTTLPPKTLVIPGHGPVTNIRIEQRAKGIR